MFATSAVVALIVVATALLISPPTNTPHDKQVARPPQPQARQVETQRRTPPQRHEVAPEASRPPAARSTTPPATNTVAPAVSGRVLRPLAGRPDGGLPVAPSARNTAPTERPVAAGDSLQAAALQAAGLLASGQIDEAAKFFDAIVMRNPRYQLDPARTSPEALSAFRSSKRALLPALARRHYQDARVAFDAGDFSLAIVNGERASALLNDADIPAEPDDLSAEVTDLLARASAARTAEEEMVYTIADGGVTPPRPLGRQLSAASLSHISLRPTGRLEILVGRSGRVETVRLDTPVNGYHDRMLVSAVKAWHYKPALRNGRPVRFSLVMTISLPDS